MKKVAMMMAAVALAVVMSGCFCSKKVECCGAMRGCRRHACNDMDLSMYAGCVNQAGKCFRKPYCPKCGERKIHYGFCPEVKLYEDKIVDVKE